VDDAPRFLRQTLHGDRRSLHRDDNPERYYAERNGDRAPLAHEGNEQVRKAERRGAVGDECEEVAGEEEERQTADPTM
jgi:hypothetical protein